MKDKRGVNTKRSPSIRSIRRDDHVLYIHPDTNEFIPGVTSIIGNLPKPFLKEWGQKLVAQDAVAKRDQVNRLADVDPEAAVNWLKNAPNRFTAHAAKVGHIAHDHFEQLSLGNTLGDVEPELQPYVDHFKDYLDTYQPEFLMLEEGVWDDVNDYAGTFDAVVRYNQPDVEFLVGDELVPLVGVAWQDNKTTRSGVHAEVGLQLAAYRYAPWVLNDDGSTVPNHPGDFALVLHIRPEGWELIPVEAGPDELEVFLNLRKTTDWTRNHSKRIIGKRIGGNRKRRAVRGSSKEV